MTERDYDDVPGTYVLDGRSYRRGYHLNMFCMSLNKAECRKEFAKDENAYLQTFAMTEEQRQAVLERNYLGMLKLGANVYYAFKLVSHDRQPPQVMYGKMSDPELSFDEFQQMMLNGGRPIEGNRGRSRAMASRIMGMGTSHAPALAPDNGKTHEDYWQKLFAGFGPRCAPGTATMCLM